MPTLIIPDIHEQIDKFKVIDKKWPTQDRIYLGDWFDSFKTTDASRQATVDYLATELTKPGRTFIMGNHDFQYVDSRGRCSGYSKDMAARIAATLPVDWHKTFVTFHEVHGWLLSHAGFNKPPDLWVSDESMRLAVGHTPGGTKPHGGPLWLDWDDEFQGIPIRPQIVGHSKGKYPRIKGNAINLDTNLNHVAELSTDGQVSIIALES